jgi:hypothetical protein
MRSWRLPEDSEEVKHLKVLKALRLWRTRKPLTGFVVFGWKVTIRLWWYSLSSTYHVQKQTENFKDKENKMDNSIWSKWISTTLTKSRNIPTSPIKLLMNSIVALTLSNISQVSAYIRTWRIEEYITLLWILLVHLLYQNHQHINT